MSPEDDGASREDGARSPCASTIASTPVTLARETDAASAIVSSPSSQRYAVIQRLGEGGMGDVWLCEDQLSGREIAEKRMRPELVARVDLRARFVREARIQGRLEHPSIVPLYELGLASGAPFFTMKRVEGATLSHVLDLLRRGDEAARATYTRHKLLSAFASVCLTIDFAHANGVVHRDLKPDNVMLGSYGELYVLDWGIAKLVDDAEPDPTADAQSAPERTRAGALLGTLGYMAPEQLAQSADVDARADIHALGAILFEIVTLEPLYRATEVGQMLLSMQGGVDARPSRRAPACGAPPDLDDVCVKATARDREARYRTARELYDAVERFREKDLDLERRRLQADEHARIAADAARAAEAEIDPEAPRRRQALREASLALALDPLQPDAVGIVGKLLARPPTLLPAAVQHEVSEQARFLYAKSARTGAILLVGWFAYLPLMIMVGFRNVSLYAAVSALFVAAAAWSFWQSRSPPSRVSLGSMLIVTAPLSALSTVWSPLVLVAPAALIYAAANILVAKPRSWPVREVAVACATVGVPVALAALHVVAPFFAFEGTKMVILPLMLAIPATVSLPVATVTLVLITSQGFAWAAYLRDRLTEAERTVNLQAWQLRHLVTSAPRTSRSVPPSAPEARSGPPDEPGPTMLDTGAGRRPLDAPLACALGEHAPGHDRACEVDTPGEGRVLLVEDDRVGRTMAMKRSRPGDAEECARVRDEGRIRAGLQHPAILPVYDVGTDVYGCAYFTMRRPRGLTLAESLSLGRRSLQSLLDAFCAAAQAVDYAHARGVVHRDLSPERVLLGGYGEVYVTGWGSATHIPTGGGAEMVRADVAALARILTAILSSARQRLHGEWTLTPADTRYVPPELEAICERAEGFASASALHDEVARFLEGERDVAKRRASAAAHLARAEEAQTRAFTTAGDGSVDRADAMRYVNQALALDPRNLRAARIMMELLTVPPRSLPPDAERDMLAAGRGEQRRGARIGGLLYLTWFLYAPFVLAQPGASPRLVALVSVAFACAAGAMLRASREGHPAGDDTATVAFSMLAAASLGTAAGPLVLVPTMILGNLIGFVLQARRQRRGRVLAFACLGLVVPVALQWFGVLPPSYETKDSALVVLPHLVAPTPWTPLVLALVQIMVVFCACIFFRRFRDTRNKAEEAILLHRWQLSQLVLKSD